MLVEASLMSKRGLRWFGSLAALLDAHGDASGASKNGLTHARAAQRSNSAAIRGTMTAARREQTHGVRV